MLAFFLLFYAESLLPMFSQTYYIFDTMMEQPIVWVQMIAASLMACLGEYGFRVMKSRKDGRYWPKVPQRGEDCETTEMINRGY